jgi:hypothetical protein
MKQPELSTIKENLLQNQINLYKNSLKKEILINSPEAEINFHSLNNLEDYSEIIPQKIEKEKEKEKPNINLETETENIMAQNLEFSFGKDLKKHMEINRLKTDYLDKKEVLSDNLSNYQMTDSMSNFVENNNDNKKIQLIKEKFISTFKNKERNESLERAFTLFQKFHNNLNNNNKMNLSFSHKLEKPFQFLTSQSTNSLSIIDKNNKKQNDANKTLNGLKHNHTLNIVKSNDDFFKYKIKKISKIIKENPDENNDVKYNEKTYDENMTRIIKKRPQNKKIFSLKDDKKKGVFIRKVIREEKYFIDDDGTEKLIGIKQSTYDTHDRKKKIKKINVNKIKNDKNKALFNKKKFAEYIKDKITNKNTNRSSCIQDKITNNDSNMKNIEINTEFINNKNINNDNCNNIKIVINKINKINSNPKINLNFIKKYKSGLKSLQTQSNENKENKICNENNINQHPIPNNKNEVCKTEINSNNKKIHMIKVTKPLNQAKIKTDILNNFNSGNNLNKYHRKIKMNLPLMGKLKLIKCEKINNNIKKPLITIKKINTNRINTQGITLGKRDLTKRNYSFKEIRNLSNNNITSNKYVSTKHLERNETEINNPKKNSNIESYKDNTNNNMINNLKIKKYLIETLNKKNRFNHNFYESKSFSLQNNNNLNFKSNNTIIIDSSTPNSNRINYYKYAFNNFNKNENDKENNKISYNNMTLMNNNNIYAINTSFNNIYKYNSNLN